MDSPDGISVYWEWRAFGLMIGKGDVWFITIGFLNIEFWPKRKPTSEWRT